MKFISVIIIFLLSGCTASQGPEVVILHSAQYGAFFDAAVVISANDGMKPVLLDRRSGVISTSPAIAGSFIEPWKPHPSTPRQGLENTLSLQRRTARFEFTPVAVRPQMDEKEGDLVGPDLLSGALQDLTTYDGTIELRVWVYVDRYYTQGIRRGTWTLSSESRTEVLPSQEPWEQVPGKFWTSINRDVAKERELLAAIEATISP